MRRSLPAAALVLLLSALLPAQATAVTLRPGHLLVADYTADSTSDGAIIDVNPKTGKQTLVSANSQAVNTGDPLFEGGPTDVQVLRDGTLLVADYAASSLFTVDPATGKQTAASIPSDPGPDLDFVISAVPQANGTFLASAEDALGGTGGLFSVDPSTGATKTVSSNQQPVNSAAPLFSDPGNSFVSPRGKILTIDDSAGGDGKGALIAVAKSGRQKLVSDNSQAVNSARQLFDDPRGVLRTGDGRIFVSNESGGTIVTVNAKTGKQKLLASGAPLVGPEHLALDRSGKLLTADYSAARIFRINPATGHVTTVSSNDQTVNVGNPLFDEPFGITVVPPKCFGQFATITGTDGRDTLKGTRFPDVIAGLGGKDKIKGLAGDDRICGGGGKDEINPGPGHDHVKP